MPTEAGPTQAPDGSASPVPPGGRRLSRAARAAAAAARRRDVLVGLPT